ncbi:MAG: hypothetical protein L6247_08990 [Desulfobacteraceae bacterium]|nr:hypothetical protein [Pseudomonadota bacterium]MCG2755679.1 hypothetical protein [Desulfobacteraceae bacterium]
MHEPRPVVTDSLDEVSPKEIIEKEKKIKPPGPPPFSEKFKPIAKDLTKDTRLYSLVFENAPLSEVLGVITSDSDLNFSVESAIDLSKPVTVHLKNVTFKEALDMVVLNGAGYAWKIEEGCLYVNRFEERIYHLDYLDMAGETDIQVGGDMLASGVEGSGVSGKFELKVKRSSKDTDVWAGVKEALEGLKSAEGILRINRNAGIIYMADIPRNIASMVRFLDALSESLHRQVFIEAKILDVQLSDAYAYGIDWQNLGVGFSGGNVSFPDNMKLDFNSGAFTLANSTYLNAALDFLRTRGDVTVLSNPHLSVMNGQSAVMTVGYQFPYGDITGVDRDATTGDITYGTSIKRAVLGMQLGITPQISKDGIITLHIVPTITRIQGNEDVDIPTTATATQTISNPIIALQELATTVRVREGNTVVLAGLISQMRQLDHKGLPFFSRIPLIKYFFKHIEQTEENKELVIFITPYIKEIK